jgi:hypothetical protein
MELELGRSFPEARLEMKTGPKLTTKPSQLKSGFRLVSQKKAGIHLLSFLQQGWMDGVKGSLNYNWPSSANGSSLVRFPVVIYLEALPNDWQATLGLPL